MNKNKHSAIESLHTEYANSETPFRSKRRPSMDGYTVSPDTQRAEAG